jgi:hypothetical protein
MNRISGMSLKARFAQESEELVAAEFLASRMHAREQATCDQMSLTVASRCRVLDNRDLLQGCIMSFYDADSLVVAASVSHLWYTVATRDSLWKALALARWPCLGAIPTQVASDFRALYASRAREGMAASADSLEGEQFWILVEMPNVAPAVGGAAHLSCAFELGTVVTNERSVGIRTSLRKPYAAVWLVQSMTILRVG